MYENQPRKTVTADKSVQTNFPWTLTGGQEDGTLFFCVCALQNTQLWLNTEMLQSLLEVSYLCCAWYLYLCFSCLPVNANVRAVCITDRSIQEICVSKQQQLGGEKILQCCFLATFYNCSTKADPSCGIRPSWLFVLIIQKILMCL